MSTCLVMQRTGHPCRSCWRLKPRGRRVSYAVIRLNGLCCRCKKAKSVRGVFCAPCYDRNAALNAARREPSSRAPRHVICHVCWGVDHFAKTCTVGRAATPEERNRG
jgi:hypothetical protein